MRLNILKIYFSDFRSNFSVFSVFFTNVVKTNIIAIIKTKFLRPVLSVKNPPFQKYQPLLHSALLQSGTQNIRLLCKWWSPMLRSVSELLLLLPFMDPSQLDGCCMLEQQRGGQSAQLPTLDPGGQCFPCLTVSITWLCFPCFQY